MPAAYDPTTEHRPISANTGSADAAIAGVRSTIQGRAGDWTRLLQELIRIPSPFEHEDVIVKRVCQYLAAIGVTPTLVPMDAGALRGNPDAVAPISSVTGRNNVVARLPGRGGGRSLILNCHLDIQAEGDPREWTHAPFSGYIDPATNAIFGRGAMDDKAGVAICLGLLQCIVEQRLQLAGDLVIQFVLEDEITGNGSLACLEAGHVADAAIILDGTRPDRAIDRHAGNMEFTIALKGNPASVSVSHMGANAAELLSRLLLKLRDEFFRLNEARQPPWTEFPSPYQFVIHGLVSDAPRFSVPVEASARCFVTFPPPDTLASMRQFLAEQCGRHVEANGYPHAPVFLWEGFAAEPVSCESDALGAVVRQAAQRNRIPELRIGPSTGTSDMRHFSRRDIPCLLYGPGRGFNPHRADEHYFLDDLPRMMGVYFEIAIEWCGVAPT